MDTNMGEILDTKLYAKVDATKVDAKLGAKWDAKHDVKFDAKGDKKHMQYLMKN